MKTCPYCGRENREGVFFCEDCGHPFVGGTGVFTTTQLVPDDVATFRGRVTWGTARFDQDSTIILRVRDHATPIHLESQEETLLGRTDSNSDAIPDVDFASFGAAEQGVSRRHAIIRRGEDTLTLIDLDSKNGTFLNGQRLVPRQPRVLRDGDEIRLGRLIFHVFFK